MHTGDKNKAIKTNSEGRTEKHKYALRDHSRRLQVIFDAHPNEFNKLFF